MFIRGHTLDIGRGRPGLPREEYNYFKVIQYSPSEQNWSAKETALAWNIIAWQVPEMDA